MGSIAKIRRERRRENRSTTSTLLRVMRFGALEFAASGVNGVGDLLDRVICGPARAARNFFAGRFGVVDDITRRFTQVATDVFSGFWRENHGECGSDAQTYDKGHSKRSPIPVSHITLPSSQTATAVILLAAIIRCKGFALEQIAVPGSRTGQAPQPIGASE
jgi:hypothetical protein